MKNQKQAVLLLFINPENGQEVLSVSRKDDHTKFGLPGGKVEEEEVLTNALVREVFEELGVKIDPHKLVFLFQDWDSDYDTLTYVYDGALTLPSEVPFINKEGAKVEYIPASLLIKEEHSPFAKYNLDMFKKFLSDLDFISYQKHNQ